MVLLCFGPFLPNPHIPFWYLELLYLLIHITTLLAKFLLILLAYSSLFWLKTWQIKCLLSQFSNLPFNLFLLTLKQMYQSFNFSFSIQVLSSFILYLALYIKVHLLLISGLLLIVIFPMFAFIFSFLHQILTYNFYKQTMYSYEIKSIKQIIILEEN